MKSPLKNWEWKKLEEVSLSVSAGGTPRRNIKEYWEHGTVPWLKISDLKSVYITSSEEKITEKGLKESSAKLFPKGTVIYSIFATLGAIAILDIEATTNQAIAGIVPDNKKIDTKFLFYCLKSERENILKKKSNATQDNINLGILRNHEIPVPPLPIQHKIVSILERAESLKQKREQANEETNTIIQSIFYKMFGNVTNNQHNFEITTIGDVAQLQGGYAFKSNDYKKEGVKLVTISNVHYSRLIWDEITHLPEDYLIKYSSFALNEGDLVIAMTRPIIKSLDTVKLAAVQKLDVPALLNQRVGRFKISNKKINKKYLEYLCYGYNFKKEIEKFSSVSLQPNVSSKQIESIKVLLPPISLQNQFASIVEKIESIKNKQNQATNEINILFDALMQKAFNGELVG